jgi:hypothetical protein
LGQAALLSAADAAVERPLRTEIAVRSEQLNVLTGERASVTGRLLQPHRRGAAGKVVSLQALGPRGWRTIARARTGHRGGFRISYVPWRLGSEMVRLRFAGDARDLPSHRRLGQLSAFRLAGASWYGGGGGLACGGQLTSATMGVANKTLPCGTMVTLRYGDRSVRVPVIDRGPYVEGREYDLTEATRQALGFGDTGRVWSSR